MTSVGMSRRLATRFQSTLGVLVMGEARVFYFCYAHNRPTGGQKHTYRHVDILNKHGFTAFIFHPIDNFRLTWFENDTRVIGYSEFVRTFDPTRDFVVLPEDLGLKINEFEGQKVIFNKNLFYGFRCYPNRAGLRYPYFNDVVAVFTVSEHNRAQLQFAYPSLHIERVYSEIRPDIFSWRAVTDKKPQIACIGKNPESLMAVYHTMQARAAAGFNNGTKFKWIFLGDKSEIETAAILRESLLFIFLSVTEGMPRMPLEAMSCGCLLATYGHGPLKEVVPATYRFEYGDVVGLTVYIEAVMASFPNNLERWASVLAEGREIAASYSLERQETSVISAWRQIIGRRDRDSREHSTRSMISITPTSAEPMAP
jgi:Glycosyl transferases group 1